MDCNLLGSSVHGDSLGKNTGVGCHVLLRGIFPTQGSNLGLPLCRWILYHLSHQGSQEPTNGDFLRGMYCVKNNIEERLIHFSFLFFKTFLGGIYVHSLLSLEILRMILFFSDFTSSPFNTSVTVQSNGSNHGSDDKKYQ